MNTNKYDIVYSNMYITHTYTSMYHILYSYVCIHTDVGPSLSEILDVDPLVLVIV